MSGHASSTDAEALAIIINDEIAPIPSTSVWNMAGFTSRRDMGRWMDEKGVSLSIIRGRRYEMPTIPQDLCDEVLGSLTHMDDERTDACQLLTPIAQKLDVEVEEDAILHAIQRLQNSYVDQQALTQNLMDGWEEMVAGRKAAEDNATKLGEEIEYMEVQISAMCEWKCARGEYEARQALQAVRDKLENQRSMIYEKERMLLDMDARNAAMAGELQRQRICIEGYMRERQEWQSCKERLDSRIAAMKRQRANVGMRWPRLAAVWNAAERNAEPDPRGYRLDEATRELVVILDSSQASTSAADQDGCWGRGKRAVPHAFRHGRVGEAGDFGSPPRARTLSRSPNAAWGLRHDSAGAFACRHPPAGSQ